MLTAEKARKLSERGTVIEQSLSKIEGDIIKAAAKGHYSVNTHLDDPTYDREIMARIRDYGYSVTNTHSPWLHIVWRKG